MAGDLAKYARDNKTSSSCSISPTCSAPSAPSWCRRKRPARCRRRAPGFAGFATWLDQTPAHPDLLVMPDAASVIPLPWRPEVAWVAGEPWMSGQPLDQAPRVVLRRMVEREAKKNIKLMTGVEPESTSSTPTARRSRIHRDTQEKPCYDQSAIMRRFDVIGEICSTMTGLGWGPLPE